MRRIIPIAVAAALALLLAAGCGDEAADGAGEAPAMPSAPAVTDPATPPEASPTEAAGDSATLYADNCAACHDADGSGGSGPDLRGEDDVGGVAEQIRAGGGSMPAFAGELTDAEIDDLAAFVVSQF